MPTSQKFSEFHPEFMSSFDLPFGEEKNKMSTESVKKCYVDMKGKLNVALANWKTSGNGAGNKSSGKRLLFFGTDYANDSIDENQEAIEYVNDDRFDFCMNSISVGYFWCMAEACDMVSHVSQNCESIGVTMTKIAKVNSMNCYSNSKKQPKKREHSEQMIIIQSIKELCSSNEKRMKLREKQTLTQTLLIIRQHETKCEENYLHKEKDFVDYKNEQDPDDFLLTTLKEMVDHSKEKLLEARQMVKKTKQQIRDCKENNLKNSTFVTPVQDINRSVTNHVNDNEIIDIMSDFDHDTPLSSNDILEIQNEYTTI